MPKQSCVGCIPRNRHLKGNGKLDADTERCESLRVDKHWMYSQRPHIPNRLIRTLVGRYVSPALPHTHASPRSTTKPPPSSSFFASLPDKHQQTELLFSFTDLSTFFKRTFPSPCSQPTQHSPQAHAPSHRHHCHDDSDNSQQQQQQRHRQRDKLAGPARRTARPSPGP